jgi:hypothetical protein
MAAFPNPTQLITELYIAYFNRAPDPVGLGLWVSNFNAGLPITTIAQDFSNSSEAQKLYPFLALPTLPILPIAQNFVATVYNNLLNRVPDTAGLNFWANLLNTGTISPSNFVLDVLQSINIQAQTTPLTADAQLIENKVAVADFYTNLASVDGTAFSPILAHLALQGPLATAAQVTAAEAFITANINDSFSTFTLTTGQDHFAGTGGDIFNAPLSGILHNQTTLTAGDSLTDTGPSTGTILSVLNATFDQHDNQTIRSLNIINIPIWNIDLAGTGDGTITLTGDGLGGPNIISGLRVLNVTFDEGTGCLIIGDNSSPVFEPNGADGFTINVSDATGDGVFFGGSGGFLEFDSPCVDVDIAASAFTGHDTINVTANIVGGFRQYNGSYIIPVPILDAGLDDDTYNPNWLGYLADAFSISAGASGGNLVAALGPLNGAVGFANWNVASTGALGAGTLNIIALGGEGSQSAQTITLTDDGSNTMLFATWVSDSLSTDWTNVKTVTLTGTKGFVTLTGLETNVAEVGLQNGLAGQGIFTTTAFKNAFQRYDGGGLLASDTGALVSIAGGTGNSFYDLSSLTPAAAHAATLFQGGSSTAGNSEIAFNNAVFTSGLTVNISNVQVLDDVSSIGALSITTPGAGGGPAILENDGEAQGGVIDMNNFAGLSGLNQAYALLAQGSPTTTSSVLPLGSLPPSGLPYSVATAANFLFTPPASQAALLPSTVSVAEALDLQNGVVPAGFELLQLLNAEGSTQTVLGAKLLITDAPFNFAINMQDTADGMVVRSTSGTQEEHNVSGATWSGFDITVIETQPPSPTTPTIINTADTLLLFVSDDGVQLKQNPSHEGGGTVTGTALYVPQLTIENYTTVNIMLPTESVGTPNPQGDPAQHNYVILGGQDPLGSTGGFVNGPGFNDSPVDSVQNATVNFFDNNADNGGSPPGGEDGLVLGYTNFTATLTPAYIGVTSVSVDAIPLDFALTINDFGTGTFEIGATNVTNLNAQSTAGLIMDLPGTNTGFGINVNGSLLDQNLLQGTSGPVMPDPFGHNPSPITTVTVVDGTATTTLTSDTAIVYEAQTQVPGVGWGNDTLTGGDGFGSVITTNVSGAISQTFTLGVPDSAGGDQQLYILGDNTPYLHGLFQGNSAGFTETINGVTTTIPGVVPVTASGNTGDNFFPEGGTDTVNIAAGEIGTLTSYQDVVDSSGTVLIASGHAYANFSTVWVGFYEVCNSGGSDAGILNNGGPFSANSGVGTVYDQAITDLNADGEQIFVDGYGASGQDANDPTHTTSVPSVTINGFHLGGPLAADTGDTIEFGLQSWASGPGTIDIPPFTSGTPPVATDNDIAGTIVGLVKADGENSVTLGFATYGDVSAAGHQPFMPGTPAAPADVILDDIAPNYQNAQALQHALATSGVGNIELNGLGVLAAHEVDILVAYNSVNPTTGVTSINIADVTLTNANAAGGAAINDTALLNPVVHDLVHLPSLLGLANFAPHNINFLA